MASHRTRPTLLEVVNELPARAREALVLVREGASYAHAARQLQISERQAEILVEQALIYLLERNPELA